MDIRDYNAERDLEAVTRIWREVGWIENDEQAKAIEYFIDGSNTYVALIDGAAECAVTTTPGAIRYQDVDLDLSVVSAVATSWIGRKQGLATALTAHALAIDAQRGAEVSIVGMFEQGFYDLLGFGSGTYEHHLQFDPATLTVDVPYRPPVRLTVDDWEEVAATFAARRREHGGVVIRPPGFARAEMLWADEPFGLGYRSETGELTHFVFGRAKRESGPYRVLMLSFQDHHQMLELLKLLSVLGDQVRSVRLTEPAGVQIQDLLRHVVRQWIATEKSEHAFEHRSGTWWQLRIIDVPRCVAARSYDGSPVRFVAKLTDPASAHLAGGWQGVAGSYVLTVGEQSTAVPGNEAGLPVLTASINAFSRAWFGVRSFSSLAVTDDLQAAPELLADLDRALAVPQPHPDMFF